MDGTAKILVASYPIGQVVWARYFFHLLTLLPLFILFGQKPKLKQKRVGLQILRAFFLLGDTAFFFAALFFIPLANGKAVFFVSPIIMTALAPIFLRERVGYHRWVAVLVGFSGTLFILKPDNEGEFLGYCLALGSACFYAFYLLLTRKLSTSSSPLDTLLFTALVGTVVMTVALPFSWTMPNLNGWLLMLAMGLLGTLSHFFIIKAFEAGNVSQLAPFSYAEIVSATIFGVVVFGDFPNFSTWIGIALVIGCGVYIAKRQHKR
ncbi:MAG: DMT family transporter [Sneathiella sp.]|nr:DMT family transporter [Sneathiella sp.]